MSDDISRILQKWGFDPEQVTARVIEGEDGRRKLQVRVDLGVLQMELDGRPDGHRPEGFESWLAYYEDQQQRHDDAHPDSTPYQLDEEACTRLWREGVQYYHRYLSLWHLDMFDLCARDTARNLRLFSFVRNLAVDQRAILLFDQWRPYVLMMHARAVATPLLAEKQVEEGLREVEVAIDAIREFLDEYGQSDRAAECTELVSLESWRDEILRSEEEAARKRPKTAERLLREQLQEAVEREDFEEAARLRDAIRELPETKADPEAERDDED